MTHEHLTAAINAVTEGRDALRSVAEQMASDRDAEGLASAARLIQLDRLAPTWRENPHAPKETDDHDTA